MDLDLRKAIETATLDSDLVGVASKQAVESSALSMVRSKGSLRRHHLQASSSCAVSQVVRYLAIMSVKVISEYIYSPCATAITRSAVGGKLSHEGGSRSGKPCTHDKKCSIFVPSGAPSTWVPVTLGTRLKSTL